MKAAANRRSLPLFLLMALACRDNVLQSTTSTRSTPAAADLGKKPAVATPLPTAAPEAVGDQIDPKFSDNLRELAQLLDMNAGQSLILRRAFERDPGALVLTLAAVRNLSETNKDLLKKIKDELVPLADYVLLNKRLLYVTGLTDTDGRKLAEIHFVGASNEQIGELIIGKGLPTSLRVFATYDGSTARRDVTYLATLALKSSLGVGTTTGIGVQADAVSPGVVVGQTAGESSTVSARLGERTASLTLQVRDGTVTFVPVVTNELTNTVRVPSLPVGVIGSLRILAELRDFKGELLSASDISETASYSSTDPRIAFPYNGVKFVRRGLISGRASSDMDLPVSATFKFKDRTETVTAKVKITPAISMFSYFSGDFVDSSLYSEPEGIFCPFPFFRELGFSRSTVFFIGDKVEFDFKMFMSDCTTPIKTRDAATKMDPANAMEFKDDKWLALTERKSATNAHLQQEVTGIYTLTSGADRTDFRSLNKLILDIREQVLTMKISEIAGDRPRKTCGYYSPISPMPPNAPDTIRIFTWLSRGLDNCVVEDVKFEDAATDRVRLSLRAPEGALYAASDVGAFETGKEANLIRLKTPRSAEDRVLVVTATFDIGEATLRRITEVVYARPGISGQFAIGVENGSEIPLELRHEIYTANTVEARVLERSYLDGRMRNYPLSYADTVVGGLIGRLDGDGSYGSVRTGEATVKLTSPIVKVSNYASGQTYMFTAPFDGDGTLIQEVDKSRARALNAYTAIQRVRRFVLNFAKTSEVPVVASGPLMRLDYSGGACNAYFDPDRGELVFYAQGSVQTFTCANTADINDVIYHEWGHALDNAIGATPGITDGAFSEGIGDLVSAYLTGSPEIAPGFFLNSTTPIRKVQNTRTYPPANQQEREVHSQGLIIGGAFWDLRQALIQRYGEVKGSYHAGWLFFRHLLSTDRYRDSYEAVLVLDDDDGNPVTPSPNRCIINRAFADHGLATAIASCSDSGDAGVSLAGDVSLSLKNELGLKAVLAAAVTDAVDVRVCLNERPRCRTSDAYTLRLSKESASSSYWVSANSVSLSELMPITVGKFDADGRLVAARMFRIASK